MKEEIINRGKNWFQFRKGMDDYIMQTKSLIKSKKPPKTQSIGNNTMIAPHSAQRSVIGLRP